MRATVTLSVVVGLMAVALGVQAWSLASLSREVEALRQTVDEFGEVQRVATVHSGRDRAPSWSGWLEREEGIAPPPDQATPADLVDDPEAREQIEAIAEQAYQRARDERRAQWADRMQVRIEEEVASFAQVEGLDERTRTEVLQLLYDQSAAMREIHEEMDRGELAWEDAREEMHAIREETAEAGAELLGEERWEILAEQLPMRGGRGRGPF